jgi:anti-sigma-K factor RskA
MSQAIDAHALAGAYALDALSEIERAAFTRHIAGCESCAAEVAGLSEAASRLALLDEQPPPARLKAAVLNEVYRTRQLPAVRAATTAAPPRATNRTRWLAAVAAAVIGLAGMATVWVVQESRLDDVRSSVAQDQTRIATILAAPDAQVLNTTVDGGGRVTLVVAPSLDDGVIALSGLRTPAPDRAYQLWLIDDGVPASAGILAAGASSGTALLRDIGGADSVGVTLEPAGGSQRPTTRVIVDVDLA